MFCGDEVSDFCELQARIRQHRDWRRGEESQGLERLDGAVRHPRAPRFTGDESLCTVHGNCPFRRWFAALTVGVIRPTGLLPCRYCELQAGWLSRSFQVIRRPTLAGPRESAEQGLSPQRSLHTVPNVLTTKTKPIHASFRTVWPSRPFSAACHRQLGPMRFFARRGLRGHSMLPAIGSRSTFSITALSREITTRNKILVAVECCSTGILLRLGSMRSMTRCERSCGRRHDPRCTPGRHHFAH